jgi:hypothetical protein
VSRDVIGMRVCRLGRTQRLDPHSIEVGREVRADRCRAHCRAVAEQALAAEHPHHFVAPRHALRDAAREAIRAGAVAALGLACEALDELRRERTSTIDSAIIVSFYSPRRLAGPSPRSPHRDQSLRGTPRELGAEAIEHRAECIADGEPLERRASCFDLHGVVIAPRFRRSSATCPRATATRRARP